LGLRLVARPFETWQAGGWKQVAEWIADDIVKGAAMSSAPLPDWCSAATAHGSAGSCSPGRNAMTPRSSNQVYARRRSRCVDRGEIPARPHRVRERRRVPMWMTRTTSPWSA
jgi:3-hydroxyacyl-CoA dehydrogenase